jgi:hypothetical protein
LACSRHQAASRLRASARFLEVPVIRCTALDLCSLSGINDSFHSCNKENRPQSKYVLPRRTSLPTEAA